MASQLRLHVLLPLAFLGLIGAAFGVYTMGKAPGGGNDAGVPLITTHPDKTKPKPAPQATDDWVKGLEAWCGGFQAQYLKIDEPQALADYESVVGEYVELWDAVQPAFIKLGLPPQKRDTALALRRNIDETASKMRWVFNRFQALDVAAIQNQLDELDALDTERVALLRRLGAGTCLDEKNKGVARLAIQQAPLLINSQLQRYGKVVVLFYEPGAKLRLDSDPRGARRSSPRACRLRVGERLQEPRGRAARLAVQRAAVAHGADLHAGPQPEGPHRRLLRSHGDRSGRQERLMAAERAVDLQGVEVDRRSARKDGREVVALRCVDTGMNGFVVECDVYPVDAVRVEPLRPGPYTFATRAQADAFMDEAAKALTYLGCEL